MKNINANRKIIILIITSISAGIKKNIVQGRPAANADKRTIPTIKRISCVVTTTPEGITIVIKNPITAKTNISLYAPKSKIKV